MSEDQARPSEHLYRQAELAIREATLLIAADGTVHDSIRAGRYFDVEDRHLIGGPIVPDGWVLVSDDGEPCDPSVHPAARVLDDGEPCTRVVQFARLDDSSSVSLRIVAKPLPGDDAAVDVMLSPGDKRATARDRLEQQERRFLTLADTLPVAVYETTPAGEVTYVNRRYTELTGRTVDNVPDIPMFELVHPDDLDVVKAALTRALETYEYKVTYRLLHLDGSSRWVIGRSEIMVSDDGEVVGFVGTMQDVDDLHRAESNARQLATIVESSPDIVVLFDDDFRATYLNPAAVDLLSPTDGAVIDQLDDVDLLVQLCSQLGHEVIDRLRTVGAWAGTVVLEPANGRLIRLSATVSKSAPGPGSQTVFIGQGAPKAEPGDRGTDTRHDLLTGLPNRATLADRLTEPLGFDDRSGAICIVDIDRFGQVNMTHGRRIGDDVLRVVASRLGMAVGEDGVLARMSSDEFAVWTADVADAEGAAQLGRTIVEAVGGEPVGIEGHRFGLTVSVGVAVAEGETADETVHRASVAMLRAKDLGRNQAVVSTRMPSPS